MDFLLFILLILFVIVGLPSLAWFLSKRYGGLTTAKIFGGACVLSLLIGAIAFAIISRIIERWDDDIHWTHYKTIEGANVSFEYRPTNGLYTVNEYGHDVQITNNWPYCNMAGEAAKFMPEEVYEADYLNLLSAPPQEEQARINFIFVYPTNEYHTYSSFVVFESGEVWCAERHWEGMADPSDMSVGTGLAVIGLYIFNLQICTCSFILILVLLIGAFEIHRSKIGKLSA